MNQVCTSHAGGVVFTVRMEQGLQGDRILQSYQPVIRSCSQEPHNMLLAFALGKGTFSSN